MKHSSEHPHTCCGAGMSRRELLAASAGISAAAMPLLFLDLNRPAKVKSLDPIAVLDALRPALKAKLNQSAR